MAQDRDKLWALVNTVIMNRWVLYTAGNFLTS
jgi:hypothetical protein